MDSAKCVKCGNEVPVSGMMRLDGQRYCAVCGEEAMEELHRPAPAAVAPSASACTICGNGGPFQNVGGAPLCATCAQAVYNRDFPKWLKFSLAVALVLLAVALAHGARYFKAGRNLYRGEKATTAGQYGQAAQLLKPVVTLAPECQKCSLLLAKSALLSGDAKTAYEAVSGKDFESNDLFTEVKGIFARVDKGLELLDLAGKQYGEDQLDDALKTLHQAQQQYPEFKGYESFEREIYAALAFNRKDYDSFLELEQEQSSRFPNDPMSTAGVASALACKYAVTGDQNFAQEAEVALQKSRTLAGNDPEAQSQYKEFSERIQYRLKSRDIIDKKEYDRRFRAAQTAKEAE